MSENKQPGCLSAYCHITGKRAGQHTNSGCSCLRPLPLADQLALKKRLQELETELAAAKELNVQLVEALEALSKWVAIEGEVFEANTPDDDMLEMVMAALAAAKHVFR